MKYRYWVESIARQGLIGVAMSQSPEYVAPHGSTEAIFGTNPIAVGVPTSEDPLVMDLSTAAAAWRAPAAWPLQSALLVVGMLSNGQPNQMHAFAVNT